jgi:hypothetical protein
VRERFVTAGSVTDGDRGECTTERSCPDGRLVVETVQMKYLGFID